MPARLLDDSVIISLAYSSVNLQRDVPEPSDGTGNVSPSD